MTPDFENILGRLADGEVEFVLVGGLAATAHGSARATYDVDVVYARSAENVERLARVLAQVHASLRDAPPGLPFRPAAATLGNGLNFTWPRTSVRSTCWVRSPAAGATPRSFPTRSTCTSSAGPFGACPSTS